MPRSRRTRLLWALFALAVVLGFSGCGGDGEREPIMNSATLHAGQAAQLNGMDITMTGKGTGNNVGAVLKIDSPGSTTVNVSLEIDTLAWSYNEEKYYPTTRTVDWGPTTVKQGENVYDIPIESYVGKNGGNLKKITVSIPADEIPQPSPSPSQTPTPTPRG